MAGKGSRGRKIVVTHLTSPSPFKRLTPMLWLQRQPMISISQLIFTSWYHKKWQPKIYIPYIKWVWKWLGASVHLPCQSSPSWTLEWKRRFVILILVNASKRSAELMSLTHFLSYLFSRISSSFWLGRSLHYRWSQILYQVSADENT